MKGERVSNPYIECVPAGFLFSPFFSIYIFFFFLGAHPWHMEVPRLGVQLGAAAAGLCHSSLQRQILNPLSEAKD